MNKNPIFSDQEFDAELREFFKSPKREEVSTRFTANVMDQIKNEALPVKYKPVISVRAFVLIALLMGVLIAWTTVQPGTLDGGLWSLPAFSAPPHYDLLLNWQQTFFTFSFKWLSSSAIFLPLTGLVLALSVHYIFLAVLRNRTTNKVDRLYCF